MSDYRNYRVHMQSRPAMCRTFYDGHVDVSALTDVDAEQEAIERAARTHGHRDWIVTKIETMKDRPR